MGLYDVTCPVCKGVWTWHSNSPDQRCIACRMSHVKEASASVFCKVHGEQESCCMVCSDLNIQLMEAKLERAVEALRVYARIDLDPHYTYCRCDEGRKARATLLVIEK